jgi:single-strand DNA-binding protein
MNYNSVTLIGRLTKTPEKRFTPTGKVVAEFSIAINEKFGENETTQFIPIQAWGKLGEAMASYALKGRLVLVEGRISVSSWEVAPSERRFMTRVIARTIRFMDAKPQTEPDLESVPEEEIAL